MQHVNCFLPPKIGERIPGHPTGQEERLRQQRATFSPYTRVAPGIYDSQQKEIEPGRLLVLPYTDTAAREAAAGLEETLKVLKLLGNSFGSDGLVASVHYGLRYDNAFWDGSQMVFGDGDGRLFNRFTISMDVCAHELAHGVTGDLLNYQDQSGALNESMSDCFGVTVRQQALGLKQSDPTAWLVGSGLLAPGVHGRALRDMLAPGTAFNDPNLGNDDQPATMKDYDHTTSDNGGVHTNSGIPNRAFALASMAIGSTFNTLVVWQRALHKVTNPDCTFNEFAKLTVAEAGPDAGVISAAWAQVGVVVPTPTPKPAPTPTPGGEGTGGASFPGSSVRNDAHLASAARRRGLSVSDWMNRHFDHYFD